MGVGVHRIVRSTRLASWAFLPPTAFPLAPPSSENAPKPSYRPVLFLLLVCVVFRVGSAVWWGDLLWADSVFYHQIVLDLEQGNLTKAFELLGLNLYPVILLWLDRLGGWVGLDWTVVGKWWSVAMASLAILPLWGWVRRIFDERVAFWAGLFYAIHPHLVGHSPLIIRDPTYWFLFNMALYLAWRAITEGRLGLFLGGGLVLGLAAYTRIEGCLLVVVLLGWTLARMTALPQGRWRLALGALLALAIIPTAVVLVNVTWLRHHSQWEWGRIKMFFGLWDWVSQRLENLFSSQTHPPVSSQAPASFESDSGASMGSFAFFCQASASFSSPTQVGPQPGGKAFADPWENDPLARSGQESEFLRKASAEHDKNPSSDPRLRQWTDLRTIFPPTGSADQGRRRGCLPNPGWSQGPVSLVQLVCSGHQPSPFTDLLRNLPPNTPAPSGTKTTTFWADRSASSSKDGRTVVPWRCSTNNLLALAKEKSPSKRDHLPASKPPTTQKDSLPPQLAPEAASHRLVSEWVQARRVALRLLKTLSYPYALLIGIGLLRAWRVLFRADQLVILLHNVFLFLATWAYQSFSGGIDLRYFSPLLMTALPYAVLGFGTLLAVFHRRTTESPRQGESVSSASSARPATALAGVLVLAVLGLFDVQPTAVPLMRQQTALGQWILRTQGPGAKIFCTESAAILLEYYAQGECRTWARQADADPNAIRQLLIDYNPNVVALWEDPIYSGHQWMSVVIEVSEELGYQEVRPEELPEAARRVRVWQRPRTACPKTPY